MQVRSLPQPPAIAVQPVTGGRRWRWCRCHAAAWRHGGSCVLPGTQVWFGLPGTQVWLGLPGTQVWFGLPCCSEHGCNG